MASKRRERRRKLLVGAAYAVPLSDGSSVPAILRATKVVLGGSALVLVDRRLPAGAELTELMLSAEEEILAFLLAHPDCLDDGTWPLLTEAVTIERGVDELLNVEKMTNLVVYAAPEVELFLEACMGLRGWDQPLDGHAELRPQDMLLAGRRRPSSSRRRLNVVPGGSG